GAGSPSGRCRLTGVGMRVKFDQRSKIRGGLMSGRPHRWVNQHAPTQILPKALKGEGVYLYDAAGRRYIDGSGGPALFCLGHSHPEVLAAMRGQLEALEFGYTTTFTTDAIDALSELLVEQAGGNLTRVSYVSGGSEANETAMKLALQV